MEHFELGQGPGLAHWHTRGQYQCYASTAVLCSQFYAFPCPCIIQYFWIAPITTLQCSSTPSIANPGHHSTNGDWALWTSSSSPTMLLAAAPVLYHAVPRLLRGALAAPMLPARSAACQWPDGPRSPGRSVDPPMPACRGPGPVPEYRGALMAACECRGLPQGPACNL